MKKLFLCFVLLTNIHTYHNGIDDFEKEVVQEIIKLESLLKIKDLSLLKKQENSSEDFKKLIKICAKNVMEIDFLLYKMKKNKILADHPIIKFEYLIDFIYNSDKF